MTQKGEIVERLQAKASSIGRILTNLEKKYNNTHRDESDFKKSPSGQQLSSHQPPSKRAHVKIQQIPPFNASKIRKSPSTENTEAPQQESTDLKNEPIQEEAVKNEE